jgi:hypothetical protein
MNQHLDPHQFNAVLQHIDRLVPEMVDAELKAVYDALTAQESHIAKALQEVLDGCTDAAIETLEAALDTSVRA